MRRRPEEENLRSMLVVLGIIALATSVLVAIEHRRRPAPPVLEKAANTFRARVELREIPYTTGTAGSNDSLPMPNPMTLQL